MGTCEMWDVDLTNFYVIKTFLHSPEIQISKIKSTQRLNCAENITCLQITVYKETVLSKILIYTGIFQEHKIQCKVHCSVLFLFINLLHI